MEMDILGGGLGLGSVCMCVCVRLKGSVEIVRLSEWMKSAVFGGLCWKECVCVIEKVEQ